MQPQKLLVLVLFISLSLNVKFSEAQEKEDLKSIFVEAESYFLYEEYNEALGLYLQLVRLMPENANINYKLGRCYLHSDYKKELSIPYLEKASKSTTDKYKVKSFKEVNAPVEVFYFLGEAYRVTNQLDKAIETYENFLAKIDEEVYDKELVVNQIEACKRAKVAMNNPIFFEARNLGNKINTNAKQSHPVLSGDGKQLAFVTKLPFYDAIFYTEKDENGWKEPRNLTPEIKVDGGTFPTSMSYDGKEMYLYKLDDYNGNLYVTRLENNKWSIPVELENINTKYWESHASISKDKQTLYFTSNRPGGYGDLDIYVSKRISDFEWGEPKNLGPKINSQYNDDTPFITADGKSLYFSSLGHKTMGGYDIFVSDLKNSEWIEPKNIGYPINTTSDELFFMPFRNGVSGYMPMIRKEGFGLYDIYEIEIFSELNPRKIKLQGKIKNASEGFDFEKLVVEVFDKSNNKISESNIKSDGSFDVTAQSGDVIVKISGRGINDYSKKLNIPIDYKGEFFSLEPELEKTKLFAKEEKIEEIKEPLLELDFDAVEISLGEKVEIKIRTDRGVEVQVKTENESGDVYFGDSFTSRRRRNSITFNPQVGRSITTITVTDNEGNSIQKEVTIITNEGNNKEEKDTEEVITKEKENTRDNDFVIILNDLISVSKDELHAALIKIESENKINSLNELIAKLYEESENGLYSSADVDRLLAQYAEKLIEEYNIKQLQNSVTPELSNIIRAFLEIESPSVTSKDFIDYFIQQTTNPNIKDLIPILVNLAKEKIDSFKILNKILASIIVEAECSEITENYVGKAFDKENLTNYFTEIINGVNAKEIYQKILEKLLLENIINEAYELATGNLKAVFKDLLENGNQFEQSKDLVEFIFVQSGTRGFGKDEVIKLLFELNKTIHEEEINEEIRTVENQTEHSIVNNRYYWFAGGGLILIIWLILLLRKKKNK